MENKNKYELNISNIVCVLKITNITNKEGVNKNIDLNDFYDYLYNNYYNKQVENFEHIEIEHIKFDEFRFPAIFIRVINKKTNSCVSYTIFKTNVVNITGNKNLFDCEFNKDYIIKIIEDYDKNGRR